MALLRQKNTIDLEEFQKRVLSDLRKMESAELLILRGHMLIEFLLTKFIENQSAEEGFKLKDTSFQFSQKIVICRILGLFPKGNQDIYEQIKTINSIRNDIAHELKIDEKLLANLYKYYKESKKSSEELSPQTGFSENAIFLSQVFVFICGRLIGSGNRLIEIENEYKNILNTVLKKNPKA